MSRHRFLQRWLPALLCACALATPATADPAPAAPDPSPTTASAPAPAGSAPMAKPASPPPFQALRYEEDYSYLADPAQRSDRWDALKYVRWGKRPTQYLTLGGEARERYEFFHNYLWGEGPQDGNGYLLQRYMLHGDLHFGRDVRLFAQLKSGIESGREGGPRPPDEDRLDLHQAFLDVSHGQAREQVTLRLGRQELQYGSSRLVSTREGPNVRQSFDGARFLLRKSDWRVDGFAARPVETNPPLFDDGPDPTRAFWGVYAVHPFPLLPGGNIDLYYLGLDREDAEFDQGIAHELRHSVGTRLWGKSGAWDYDTEMVYQFGRFGRGDIQAWTVATHTGYTFRDTRFTPRISLRADVVSGDGDPRDRRLGTFNALFPRGSYFGEAGLIGPANLIDLHPALDLRLRPNVTLTADCDFFWRESRNDGLYGNAINLIRSGRGSDARYVGHMPSLTAVWQIDRHLSFTASYSHFFAGPFLRESGPGRDVDFFTCWGTYRF